jgi:dTDP-4-amino-4,6-dideoxy-D-galactose acyltransferase
LASLSVLPWDSERIGLAAARLNHLVAAGACVRQRQVKRALLTFVLGYAADHGIQHLSVRLDASDLSGIHILEESGFVTVDGLLTFALELDGIQFAEPNEGFRVRLTSMADSERVADLAHQAYVYDRFHADPAIPGQRADELHANWLRNSCAGTAADAVLLAEDDQDLLGFVTCKLQPDTKLHLGETLGTIVLVATAEKARRRGVASATTLAALKWFYEQGVAIVEVGTQLRNIPASRLYESKGFRLVGSSVSLRKLL